MGILTSYLGNQMGSNPSASTGDFLANYFGNQLSNSNNQNPQANVKPESTTISYNDDGTTQVTHKQTIGKDSAASPCLEADPVIVISSNSV